jgi:multiple antibiotic resistance protein
MESFTKDFVLVFLPLLVAMDPLATVPFLVPFLGSLPPPRRNRVILVALATGLAVGVGFLAIGRGVFAVLGITVSDFLVAGGLVLLVVSLRELLSQGPEAPLAPNELMAVVPVGTPLLVGPATISMLILLSGLYPLWLVVLAFVLNILVAWLVLSQASRIVRFLGQGGLLAFSKVVYLLLVAIAVQLIRLGVKDFLANG